MHRLEHELDIFGIVECYNASLKYLSKVLGCGEHEVLGVAGLKGRADSRNHAGPVVAGDESRHRRALTQEEKALILRYNQLDQDFYTVAKGLLRERMRVVVGKGKLYSGEKENYILLYYTFIWPGGAAALPDPPAT